MGCGFESHGAHHVGQFSGAARRRTPQRRAALGPHDVDSCARFRRRLKARGRCRGRAIGPIGRRPETCYPVLSKAGIIRPQLHSGHPRFATRVASHQTRRHVEGPPRRRMYSLGYQRRTWLAAEADIGVRGPRDRRARPSWHRVPFRSRPNIHPQTQTSSRTKSMVVADPIFGSCSSARNLESERCSRQARQSVTLGLRPWFSTGRERR